jgi:hypothetical protein
MMRRFAAGLLAVATALSLPSVHAITPKVEGA